MNIKEILAGLGGFLLSAAIILALGAIGAVFVFGYTWASVNLLPWFSILTLISLGLVIFIFLPLAIFKTTRGFSSIAMFIASYIFGATLWMEGFLLTLFTWGIIPVFLGLFIFGIGVVPIAMLAMLLKGMWWRLLELSILTIMTYASRIGALSLAESLERMETFKQDDLTFFNQHNQIELERIRELKKTEQLALKNKKIKFCTQCQTEYSANDTNCSYCHSKLIEL